MSGECHSVIFCILKCLFHLYLWFLYCRMSIFICIRVSLLIKDPKTIESCWVGALEGRIPPI